MKFPVVNRPEYIIYLEDDHGFTFIHCDVLVKWTKQIKQQLQKSFKLLINEYDKEFYALHTPNDKKHLKFLKLFNFKYFTQITGNDGNIYEIYIWR